MQRLVLWNAFGSWRAEVARIDLTQSGVRAEGTQLGIDPLPYRLDYKLDAADEFVTRGLEVEATGERWARRIRLVHAADGTWSCDANTEGRVRLPPAGGDMDSIAGALDCDLAYSPMTNLMPIRRHGLHRRADAVDFLMAWVSVPDLAVRASKQRYEHVRSVDNDAVVRYSSGSFSSELVVDGDGIVAVYPKLARRVDRTPS